MNKDQETLVTFQSIKSELNGLINEFELIQGCSKQSWDSLSNQILIDLWKGVDDSKVLRIIQSVLITDYGLSPSRDEVQEITDEVLALWEARKP